MGLIKRFSASLRRRTQRVQSNGTHYVGDDRRSRPMPVRATDVGILGAILALALVVWGTLELATTFGNSLLEGLRQASLDQLLHTMVAVLGSVIASLAFMRWRLRGEATSLWLGTAALLVGLVAAGIGRLIPMISSTGGLFDSASPAGRAVGLLALLGAAAGPQIDTRLTARRMVGAGAVATAFFAAALAVYPSGTDFVRGETGSTLFAAGWILVAGAHVVTARRRNSRLHLAVATTSAILALGELSRALDAVPGGVAPAATLFEAIALTVLLAQVFRDLELAFCLQRAELLDSEVAVEAESARRRAEHAAHEERAHDAKNALLAIEGAARTLERYRDRLGADQRSQLTEAVSAEIARLQELISAERSQTDSAAFSVAELLTPIATTERARGMVIEIEAPGDLVAHGRTAETAEVIRNLLDNARRYAPGSPVSIRGEADGDWAVLYVEDRGQGVERGEREAIFERGQRGSASDGTDGSGLGLFVSRRLMAEQGGDLWVEHRPGGGARFGLCLPLGTPTAGDLPAELEVVADRQHQTATGGFRWDST